MVDQQHFIDLPDVFLHAGQRGQRDAEAGRHALLQPAEQPATRRLGNAVIDGRQQGRMGVGGGLEPRRIGAGG
ncbi:hypothetical protein GGER_43950 [Serratia rubidaea]